MKAPTLKVTEDFTKQFNDVINKFKNDEVLVGIPEEKTARKNNEKDHINNATIMAINEFGSPASNIPARPVMQIGIRKAQDEIAAQFELAAVKALENGPSAVDLYYNRAGSIASNSIKKVINSQEGIKKPAESTLASRRARGFKGESALIITAQLRNSITWVVKGKS